VPHGPSELRGIAQAAEVLDAELDRYETLVAGMRRERLNSEKNLRRAAQVLGELQESEARLATHLQVLVEAITAARERQHTHADIVRARADEIARRSTRLVDLLQRFQQIGARAAEVNELVRALAPRAAEGSKADVVEGLAEVLAGVGSLVDEAHALAQVAEQEDFPDVARQAESLRLQLSAVRNRLTLLCAPPPT